MIALIVVLVAALAAANGANDVPKGVATLAGAGVASYGAAIAWGALAAFAGSAVSIIFAERLGELFSRGIVDLAPTRTFTVVVLAGVIGWVGAATVLRLPVSTTHAIVGALVGAGLVAGPETVQWGSVTTEVVLPLSASVAVAFAISTLVNAVGPRTPECVCVEPAPALGFLGTAPVRVTGGTTAECRIHGRRGNVLHALHWASGGAASFARGLNDTPKIVAIGAVSLVPAGWSTTTLALLVGAAMVTGSALAGTRVARRLAGEVVHMDDGEGLRANLTLSVLVGLGANRGLPMSTTHVATGAIAGACGGRLGRLNRRTLRELAVAWLATPPVAGSVAAASFLVLR